MERKRDACYDELIDAEYYHAALIFHEHARVVERRVAERVKKEKESKEREKKDGTEEADGETVEGDTGDGECPKEPDDEGRDEVALSSSRQ